MKSTGIVRKVDQLGRIVIPSELRNSMEMDSKDSVEIFVEGSTVILKKYIPTCIFCGESEDVGEYKEKKVCKSCLENLKK
jgi:AbrB family transcriptional regulator, transcriptional pleiotropic regulator of transition state genes